MTGIEQLSCLVVNKDPSLINADVFVFHFFSIFNYEFSIRIFHVLLHFIQTTYFIAG